MREALVEGARTGRRNLATPGGRPARPSPARLATRKPGREADLARPFPTFYVEFPAAETVRL
jgi:hypothetical protein